MIRESKENIESVFFQFNEWFSDPGNQLAKHHESVKERWVLANSMHVIDSAFFPVGLPDMTTSNFLQSGSVSWHPAGGIFCGSGFTAKQTPFSYHSSWTGPGRWGFSWMTASTRYIFSPLERLRVMYPDNFDVHDVDVDYSIDTTFKPGVFLQDRAFLMSEKVELVSLDYARKLADLAYAMAGYPL
jgi:hypothetical protein